MLALATLLAGCATTNLPYADHPDVQAVVPAGMARLTVLRTASSNQYLLRPAEFKLDGRSAGSVAYNAYRLLIVAPGPHRLETGLWDSPGRCELRFEVAAGETRFFEVAPRPEHFEAALPGIVTPEPTWGAAVVGTLIGLVGQAAEASMQACGGPFSVASIPVDAALQRLSAMRADAPRRRFGDRSH